MDDLQTMTIGELAVACMYVPGHRKEHVAFVVTHVTETSNKIPFLFCGDTIFIASCGRVFTGTHEQLYYSLQKLINLPYDTLLFCAHEYTRQNLDFAKFIDPSNPAVDDKIQQTEEILSKGDFTVGSRLGEETLYNPFYK
jgi:hydroxyacylglutathione hydrolase